MRTVLSLALVAAALAGCAAPGGHSASHERHHGDAAHAAMHAEHMAHMAAMKAPPTAPPAVSASRPQLDGGYTKSSAPEAARVYFVNLRNGLSVDNPVRVVFGLAGMGVAPAGMERAGTGHHHLLIDLAAWDANAPLPATDNVRHFGLGQTETTLTLSPGTHTLQLVLADHNHVPHHPVVASERITITVK